MKEGQIECVHKMLDFDMHGQYSVQKKGGNLLFIVLPAQGSEMSVTRLLLLERN